MSPGDAAAPRGSGPDAETQDASLAQEANDRPGRRTPRKGGWRTVGFLVANVFTDKRFTGLPAVAKLVVLFLARKADADGKSWPSTRTIAAAIGVKDRTTVQRALSRDIEPTGLLTRDRDTRPDGRTASNVYRFDRALLLDPGDEDE